MMGRAVVVEWLAELNNVCAKAVSLIPEAFKLFLGEPAIHNFICCQQTQ